MSNDAVEDSPAGSHHFFATRRHGFSVVIHVAVFWPIDIDAMIIEALEVDCGPMKCERVYEQTQLYRKLREEWGGLPRT